MISKRCPDCQEIKASDAFSRNRARSDGLAAYCKPCFNVRSAATYRRTQAAKGRVVDVMVLKKRRETAWAGTTIPPNSP